jgi:hypothetical protein
MLGLAFILLVRKVMPGWCPDCDRPALIPDSSIHVRPGATRGSAYRCLACGGRH